MCCGMKVILMCLSVYCVDDLVKDVSEVILIFWDAREGDAAATSSTNATNMSC